MFRVGTAGWSYPDWEGIVYPKGAASSGEALAVLAGLFDVLEINVTFYRPPSSRMAESWVRRVADRPEFRFTAKLWRGFTHQRDREHRDEEKSLKDGLAPLEDAGRLSAVLIQFPHSFRNTTANRAYLESILTRFSDLQLVVELRHVSWLVNDLLDELTERNVGFCNVDQPASANAIQPSTIVTGGPGYVRLHGRNRANWFRKDAGRDARYDYLYSLEELGEWADRLRLMQEKSPGLSEIIVIANNHFRGQAPANALEIMHLLGKRPPDVPASLVRAFPRLGEIVDTRPPEGESGVLPL